jgi:hypothetical protein
MQLNEICTEQLFFELQESTNKNVLGKLRFTALVAEKVNQNHRLYRECVVIPAVEKFMEGVTASGKAIGTLEHPEGNKNVLLTASHLITEARYFDDSKSVLCLAEILSTSRGRDLMVLIESKAQIGASTRGSGNVKLLANGVNEVCADYVLHSIDIVSSPSFGTDTMISAKNLFESYRPAIVIEEELTYRFHEALDAGWVGTWEEFLTLCEKENSANYALIQEQRLAGFKI